MDQSHSCEGNDINLEFEFETYDNKFNSGSYSKTNYETPSDLGVKSEDGVSEVGKKKMLGM